MKNLKKFLNYQFLKKGLGKIIDLFDSKFIIKNEINKGTEIKFSINFDLPNEEQINEFKKKKISLKKKNKLKNLNIEEKLKILIIEDNKINQNVLKYFLSEINPKFEIFIADDGIIAKNLIIKKISSNYFFDIIFSDIVIFF